MKPTQEQVIAWAREVGVEFLNGAVPPDWVCEFTALAYEAGRKDEREACAALCFQMWSKWMDSRVGNEILDNSNCPDAEDCAFAIRERGAP